MTKDEIEAIASRRPYCRSFGESVSLSRVERDELVALARDGMRYRPALEAAIDYMGPSVPQCCGCEYEWSHALEVMKAAMAKEQA
ncbi:hypothetical protein D3C87_898250 [compost metagenome]